MEWASAADPTHGHPLVNVDGLVLVQTENMSVFCLNHGVGVDRPAISPVELLGLRIAIVGVHQTAYTERCDLRGRRWNRWQRADAVLPLTKGLPCTWDGVRWARKAEHCLKDRGVAQLFHEQRNVLEHVPIVKTESPTQNVLACSSHVVRETDSRAEVLVVVTGYPTNVRVGDRAVERHQLLIGAAGLDVCPSDHVEILVPAETEIER